MSFTIRKIHPDEIKKFLVTFTSGVKKDFVEYTPKTRDFIVTQEFNYKKLTTGLKHKIFTILAAFIKGEIVGYAIGADWNGGVASLYWLGVLAPYREQGIASALLKKFEQEMVKLGVHNLELRSPERNLKFYSKRGYTNVGLIKKTFFAADDYFFYKLLQTPKPKNYLKKPINYSI